MTEACASKMRLPGAGFMQSHLRQNKALAEAKAFYIDGHSIWRALLGCLVARICSHTSAEVSMDAEKRRTLVNSLGLLALGGAAPMVWARRESASPPRLSVRAGLL